MRCTALTLEAMQNEIAYQRILIRMIIRELKYLHEATGTAPHIFYAEDLKEIIGESLDDEQGSLEGTLETLETACEQIRAEIRKEKGIRRKRRRSV